MMKRILWFTSLVMWMGSSLATAQLHPKTHPLAGTLLPNNQALFDDAMRLFDLSYDSQAHLVLRPQDGHPGPQPHFMVRESSWYALGLLVRDRAGNRPEDAERAMTILDAVLQEQYLDPNVKWYGTFKRTPEEPLPNPKEDAFRGYDPNWRHFIGTTLQMILIEYPNRIPAEMKTRMYSAIDAAVSGEIHDGRLVPSYSNIALMYGSLWDFAAVHDKNAKWLAESTAWTEEVYRLFQQYRSFNEFNAPTYYGVDLYGLGLWREYGSSARMREIGSDMEAGLWTDIADYYQPNLRNIAGPYDRAYGMDMTHYVSPTGVWMRTLLASSKAPLPEHLSLSTFQIADIWYAPQVALLGTRVPKEALAKIRTFSGPHLIDRTIDSKRTATSWVGSKAIWGGEFTSRSKDTGNKTQFHPVTVQWRMPEGGIGWIRLIKSPNVDAVANRSGVTIATDGDVSFCIHVGKANPAVTKAMWELSGLHVRIETDAKDFVTTRTADCAEDIAVTYLGMHGMRLDFVP